MLPPLHSSVCGFRTAAVYVALHSYKLVDIACINLAHSSTSRGNCELPQTHEIWMQEALTNCTSLPWLAMAFDCQGWHA